MGNVSLEDRIALLLSIKEEGKGVSFDHIFEKVHRDVEFLEKRKITEKEVEASLKKLLDFNYIYESKGLFYAKAPLDEWVSRLINERFEEINRSYSAVWLAKKYYLKLSPHILPFLRGRAISAVKIFSGKRDPIREIEPIFVRYVKYRPKPLFLTIETEEKLMEMVFDHCIDFIPYVHKLNADRPDIFVLDLDAGKDLLAHKEGFELLKFVSLELKDLLKEYSLPSIIKFSGSRGFQIWSHILTDELKGDVFKLFRNLAIFLQKLLEAKLKERKRQIQTKFPFIKENQDITTSEVAHKELRSSQILVDYSSLKPFGDVRAPFSLHYKSLLVSLPLKDEEVEIFSVDKAKPLKVLENLDSYIKASKIEYAKIPDQLLKESNLSV